MTYRVVYGETLPAWEQTFPSLGKAMAFATEQDRCGDLIFSIARVVPGEPPRSLMAAIDAAKVSSPKSWRLLVPDVNAIAGSAARPLMPIFEQPNPARTRKRSNRRTKR